MAEITASAVKSLREKSGAGMVDCKNALVEANGDEAMAMSRTPEIMADSAYAILTRPAAECTGNFFIDDEVLTEEGITDFGKYRLPGADPSSELGLDLFLGPEYAEPLKVS